MRSADIAIVAMLVVAFGVLVTAHLFIVVALCRRAPRWRSLAAFFVLPLAPYWAFRDRMYFSAAAWLIAAVTYAIARGLAA
jgi:hypothetical protein